MSKEKVYIYKISDVEEIKVVDYGSYITLENIDYVGSSGEIAMPKELLKNIFRDVVGCE